MNTIWMILFICTAYFSDEVLSDHHKRETMPSICSRSNNTNKIQCYCNQNSHGLPEVRTADCYLTNDISSKDVSWDALKSLSNITKLLLSNSREVTLKYIPTSVFEHLKHLQKVEVRHGNIKSIAAFTFSNSSSVEEIVLRNNQIEVLETNALAHHGALKMISLEKNNLIEINRNIFVDLPLLEKLYLNDNKITTIHDKAFAHLHNLKELEMDRNAIFSLNSETFSGLENLERLELNSNSLEVVGDDTFRPLKNLRSLNLEGNRIQMLDDKAFHGLTNIVSLSLARNELKTVENEKIFEGLKMLMTISFKGNKIIEFRKEVLSSIMSNFYGGKGYLDVEENNFPCDCRLEWFVELINKTQNKRLKTQLENLKCNPDSKLKEMWHKLSEVDKTETQEVEEKETNAQEADYEYYDESQLGGKLFYTDIRDLLNCTKNNQPNSKAKEQPIINQNKNTFKTSDAFIPNLDVPAPVTTSVLTTKSARETQQTNQIQVTNQGTLDLSVDDSTPAIKVTSVNSVLQNEIKDSSNMYTTSRLVTVSAKPYNKYEESEMASDEAKPDKLKAQRSVEMEPDITKSASRSISCLSMLVIVNLCKCVLH